MGPPLEFVEDLGLLTYPRNKLCGDISEKLKETIRRCGNSSGNFIRSKSSRKAFRKALEGQVTKAFHQMSFALSECLISCLLEKGQDGALSANRRNLLLLR